VVARAGPPLFVIQKHAASHLHYDLRLELDGVLKSWAVPKGPSVTAGARRLAVQVEDHPFDYASFEGVIAPGEYGGGKVIVWDCGVYSPEEEGARDGLHWFDQRVEAQRRVRAGLARGKLSIFFCGEKLKGSFALVRTATASQWLLLKHRDRFADDADVLARRASVLTGTAVEEVTALAVESRLDAVRLTPHGPTEPLPARLAPMLAETASAADFGSGWLAEPKLDGYRIIAHVEPRGVRLISRRGLDLSAPFPEVLTDLGTQAAPMIIDGELVALTSDGRASFNALQNRAQLTTATQIGRAQRETPVVFIAFDLLHFAGVDLRGSPYTDRRRYLQQCLLPAPHLQVIHVAPDAAAVYAAALSAGFEGIVAKRLDSRYEPGKRSAAWLKVKRVDSGEFIVGGYTRGKGAREPLGALLLGRWRGEALSYCGHVGSGLDERTLAALMDRVVALKRARPAFVPAPALHRPTVWVEPRLVVEVSFAEWTPDGLLRAPVFVRLREDVAAESVRHDDAAGPARRMSAGRPAADRRAVQRTDAGDIAAVLEQLSAKANQLELLVAGRRVRVTHLDRVYWPARRGAPRDAITKRDLLRYLASVSPYMLPHLHDRPLTMIRMPDGIEGERFFQKHWEATLPEFVQTLEVYSEHIGDRHAYILANDLPTLLWLGQNGTLEFHVWHSRAHLDADALSRGTDYASSAAAMESSILNYPDFLVFDLDPYIYSGKEAAGSEPEFNRKGFAMTRRVAFWLRELLKQMSLDAVVKTSGKTGLHVFVPIERTVTFDQARHICDLVGRHLLREHPRDITMEWATARRTGKVFIDHNMNVRGKTLNVAYSPRGLPAAPVSMPLSWEELEAAEPTEFTLQNAMRRLEKTGDRWHDVLMKKQSLAQAFGGIGRSISQPADRNIHRD
jgi:bifunctional non-homologous end joining protein LigD